MRKIYCAIGLAAVLLASTPAFASTSLNITCEQFASGMADEATRFDMQRAGAYDTAPPVGSGRVLVIGAGQKFYMPLYQSPDALAPKSVSQNMQDWNGAYYDALWRCRLSDTVQITIKK